MIVEWRLADELHLVTLIWQAVQIVDFIRVAVVSDVDLRIEDVITLD
jgi:hypothetical protein